MSSSSASRTAPASKPDRRESIWRLVRRIPRGQVATYGDIAAAVDPPCNPRLVGWALRQASPAHGLPWHRVLAAGGRIAVRGPAAAEQRLRLEMEGVRFAGKRVRMDLHHNPRLFAAGRRSGAKKKRAV